MSATTAHRLFAARPRSGALLDMAIAAAAFTGSLVMLSHGGFGFSASGPGSEELDWVAGLLTACSTVPLVAWRHAPRAVFGLTASASVLLGGLGYPIGLPLGSIAGLYLFAASRDETSPWTRRDTSLVLVLFAAYLGATATGADGFGGGELYPGSELLHAALAWAVAWFAGERTRLRREQIDELRERAIRAERDSECERQLATAEERARIARELHDAAGHAINVIAVRAGAARMRQDPERSQAALEAIEELARKTVGEIDHIVGTLRDRSSVSDVENVPPGLASLDTLIARHAAAGVDVSVASTGGPRRLESVVDRAAYRILQEALTNAVRHGTGTARVELMFGDTALEVTISNGMLGDGASRAIRGHGVIGMRERATLLGGRLETERINGEFRVHAHLPYEGPSA